MRDLDAAAGEDALERPVFVLGCTFRTGSTFLQRLINSSGEVFVWGENMGIAEDLRVAVAKLDSWSAISQAQHGDLDVRQNDAWIANLNPEGAGASRAAARQFFLSYYAEPTRQRGCARWGFKEVRCDARAARFLLELFPHGRVLLLVRRPEAVLASMATSRWYAHMGGCTGVLKAWHSNVESFLALDHPAAKLMRLEDFGLAPDMLEQVARHIGVDAGRFDASLIHRPVRGSTEEPKLGDAERDALARAKLEGLVAALGYPSLDSTSPMS